MGGSSKKVTVGYKYYLGMHMVLCHGPIDSLIQIKVDDRVAWEGDTIDDTITISKEELFGGESREGGISGQLDILGGGTTQSKNTYLQTQLGTDIPAFRGVVSAILKQMYLGMNPYLKRWTFRAQRIHIRSDGSTQWYDEKAEIPNGATSGYSVTDSLESNWQLIGYEQAQEGSYYTVDPDPVVRVFNPGTGARHTVTMRLDGEAELRDYTSGTTLSTHVNKDGVPGAHPLYNVYSMHVSSPAATYYLNKGTSAASLTSISNELFTIEVDDGATITLVANSVDAKMIGTYQTLTTRVVEIDGRKIQGDMNPAHIIRECLTDQLWGMGYLDTDIDDTSFSAAADTLFIEGMGISLLWDRQIPIEDFISEIVRHINAVLYVDRVSGKFTLKLIRNDYTVEDLLVLDQSNISKLSNYSRTDQGETINSVTVVYWDAYKGENSSIAADDVALIQSQGTVINTTIQYPGFTKGSIAGKVATRDLQTLSSPLLSCTIDANREASVLNIGDVFKLEWPDYHDSYVVMRVMQIALGDGKSNRVKITASEDIFSLPTVPVIGDENNEWEDTIQEAVPVVNQIAFEMPYLEAVQRQSQTVVDDLIASNPQLGYFSMAAKRPNGSSINARLYTDSGAGYEEAGLVDFCPTAILDENIDHIQTEFEINSLEEIENVETGSWFQMGSEVMKFVSLVGTTLAVERGLIDTVPTTHSLGEILYFWDAYSEADPTEYVEGESIDGKLTPVSTGGELSLAEASAESLTLSARAYRPYPPGNFKINTEYFPSSIEGALALTWSHRDRLQQTGSDYDSFTDGDIGPEAGVTYNVYVYGEDDLLGKTFTGVTDNFLDYSLATEAADFNNLVTAGDPDYASVSLLLHFDGADTSTTFTDDSPSPKTVTVFGNAQIDNAVSKFAESGLFDGNGDYLRITDNEDFNFGTGDFTIEAWIYNTNQTNNYQAIFANFNSASYAVNARFLTMYGSAAPDTSQRRKIGFGGFNLSPTQAILLSTTLINTNTWYHVAVTREGNTFRLFINGVLESSTTNTNAMDFSINDTMIGANGWDGVASHWTGNLDDMRITKGVCRYTEDFDVPTEAFPNQTGEAGGKRPNGKLRLVVESERDSYNSYTQYDHTFYRVGYGYSYGYSYGGKA